MEPASSTKFLVLQSLSGNPPAQLTGLQAFMAEHLHSLIAFWYALWLMTALVLLWLALIAWKESEK